MLPQTSTPGGNHAVSGEYGSSSEGTLQLSGNGQYLTIMGYATNADAYNNAYDPNGGGTALAQSPNSGVGGANVARVIALIGADGSVNSTTAISNVFNQNNPRSVYSANGTSFYISGQGNKDNSGGVFYVSNLGTGTAAAITGQDTFSKSNGNYNQDTRDVQIVNGQLIASVDTTEGNVKDGYNISRYSVLQAAALQGLRPWPEIRIANVSAETFAHDNRIKSNVWRTAASDGAAQSGPNPRCPASLDGGRTSAAVSA
jgi:hypothetical protein